MTHPETTDMIDVETEIQRIDSKTIAVINRSEVEAQLDAAHKYRRSVKSFLSEATTLATLNRDVAESCIYSIPRDGKVIAGPSVRLAEICASAYGNLHIGARIVDIEEKEIVAQGVAWDLEKNLRVTVENRRRITSKSGRRYNDDMITTTGNAAASIALRNAIFRVVPRTYVNAIYAKVREVAVGDAKTLDARRTEVLVRLEKIGVPRDRVFAKLDKRAVDDIGLEDLEVLIGLGTAIKNGEAQIDDLFPAVRPAPAAPEEDGKRISLGKKSKTVPHNPETGEVIEEKREPGSDG
jgi:hypothetical protein